MAADFAGLLIMSNESMVYRQMKRSMILALAISISFSSQALTQASSVTLTEGDAEALQAILKKDKLLQAMSSDKGPKALRFLSRVASMVISGPLKLELQWDQALFQGWRKANDAIVKLGTQAVCNDIALASASADTPDDTNFFDQLGQARGC